MYPRAYAVRWPTRPAMIMAETGHSITYHELDQRSSQLAWLLNKRGIGRDATVAVIAENRLEWAEVIWGVTRSGRSVGPVNWHVSDREMAEMLTACQAEVVVATSTKLPAICAMLPSLRGVRLVLVLGTSGQNPPHVPAGRPLMIADYDAAIASQPTVPVPDERLGGRVMFSAGTTGSPKAVRHAGPQVHPGLASPHLGKFTELFDFDSGTVYLSPGPTYHTAPFRFIFAVTQLGGTVICMERFDAVSALEAIETYSITHAQFVPTMLVRMLRLPEPVQRQFDLSTLKVAITGAASCPAELKQRITDWWGPVVHELYGASESYGHCHIGPHEALIHPGSVGRALDGSIHITDEDGCELPDGMEGQVWFAGTRPFAYAGQDAMTNTARNDMGWQTVGDLGWLDADGYLYLTGRRSDLIISGGVNVNPQRAEEVLALHPAVADVAVIGVPDEEFGESAKAVVALNPGYDLAAADRLLEYCRARLPNFQCPKTVDVVRSLPRGENGKLYKRVLRQSYL